ncbi:50S ribosomal protein L24 [Candidatus Schneideria nysicola]|uniref:50S ribosomal protein L24 n=1 Tax=Candidatus Schneideria nysicola TaxID=1081631 RepID=UPI001CAA716A|nr:50S ribosomal protein L24 [Candidatus Schneideria nysicola]UAJ64929.1 50S ribosomal protein L24 [Candidatus Schneideria nysicola]
MASKLHHDDEIIVITGKDKGKRGRIKSISHNKAIVSGINLVKKHQKADPSINKAGGIITKEQAIQISNIAIFNSVTGKRDRVGFNYQSGKKIRIFKSNGEVIK